MNLDERIRQGRLSRRDFVKLGLTGLTALALGQCGKNSPTGPEPPEPPVAVTLQFEVYNHTQGYRTNYSKSAMSGDPVTIKINELNVNDVDQQRIAIKEDNFGSLVRFSTAGEATFYAPKQSKNYDVILFNSSNDAPYQWMDDKISKLYKGTRNYVVYRKDRDGQTGPESIWGGEFIPEIGAYGVFDQLNQALDLGWVKWGYINRQPGAGSGTFSYGYGDCYENFGWHAGSWIGVNTKKCYSMTSKIAVGLEEGFENICSVDNIGGLGSSATIQKGGVLLPIGKDLFAYVFAKDEKTS